MDSDNSEASSEFTIYHGVSAPTAGNEVFQVANNANSFVGTPTNPVNLFNTSGDVAMQWSPDDLSLLAKEGTGITFATSDDYSYGTGYSDAEASITLNSTSLRVNYQEVRSAEVYSEASGVQAQAGLETDNVSVRATDPATGLQAATLNTSDTNLRLRQLDGALATPVVDLRVSNVQKFAVVRNGGLVVGTSSTAVSASSAQETIIGVTSTASARTITLDSDDCKTGRIVIVKDESGGAGTNNITIDTEGAELIDGAASVVITANYGCVRLYSNGTNWFSI
jgi:hypothetical protein